MKPADLEGWWLNLPEAVDRATTMQTNLQSLGLDEHYRRFEAEPGQPGRAQAMDLSDGEAGAWSSWLRLIQRASISEAAVVHLLEDDTEITEGLGALLHWEGLHSLLGQGVIVCTDGYVSPAQARHLLDHPGWGQCWQCITEGLPVPCIGSMLATPASWGRVHDLLQHHWSQSNALPPIDVLMGQLDALTVVTVAPFVTTPRLDQARSSQIRQPGDACQERSREALTRLRRLLSWPAPAGAQPWDGEWELFWRNQPKNLQQHAVLDALEGLVRRGAIQPY
jgi:hypothetical protein